MKVYYHFFILLFLGNVTAFPQCLTIDSKKTLVSSLYCFVDSSAELSEDEVIKKTFNAYTKTKIPNFLLKEYRYNYWFKFCLENPSSRDSEMLLTLGELYLQEYYIRSNSKDPETILLSQDKRLAPNAYYFDHKYLKINLKPRERLSFLVKVTDKTGQKFLLNPNLVSLSQEQNQRLSLLYDERTAFVVNISLNAVLLFVMIFVFVQYFFTRYNFLLYYGFYVFFMFTFHIYGFSYSSFFQTPFSFLPFLKFELRQNFYIILTQIFYMLFLREFFNIQSRGTIFQKKFFKIQHYFFIALLFFEVLFSTIINRLDYEMLVVLITQIFVISFSIYLFYMIFTSKNLVAPITIKLATTILFIGVIWGFLSASFGWVKTTSPILQYYPNFIFNFCVLIEIFLYSLAIGELFFKNARVKGELNQKIALSELNTLRSQINPHFLFNSLNSIKSLIIGEKPKEAASFLTDLSVLIRRILQNSREQFLTLQEELKFTEEYIKIEQRRFESGFDYKIDVPNELEDKLIPALILQPFVENSIKHGFIDVKVNYRIEIKILSFDNYFLIEIIDNGIGRIQAAKHKETGHASLGNSLIEERLKILNELYHWNIAFQIIDLEKGTKVIITIPFFE